MQLNPSEISELIKKLPSTICHVIRCQATNTSSQAIVEAHYTIMDEPPCKGAPSSQVPPL